MDDIENIDKVYNRVSELILSAHGNLTITINTSMVVLYWHIGKTTQENEIRSNRAEYGKETVRKLAENLQREYGKGYSYSNLTRMITLYNNFPKESILTTVLTKLLWSHLIEIIKQKEELKREFYITMCINEGWCGRELSGRIQSMLYERTAISKKPEETIYRDLKQLREQKEMSVDLFLKDPYMLDFLGLKNLYSEKDLENAIIAELQQFILEFGNDFAFFARQKVGVANYVTNLAAFTLKNAIWVLAWATQMMTDLAAANLMPDKSSRAGAIAVIKTTLVTNTKACIVGANDLYSLIEQSFPQNLLAAQKEAAGSAHYGKATKKTSECSTMMSMGVAYIINNHTALMTGGMLAGFQVSFTGLGTAFNNANTAYQNAIEAAALLTDAKIAAYNSIYARYQVMAKVGKNIFRNNKAVIEGIVYAQIKKKLNPPHQVVQPMNIPINGSKTIHNAVPLNTIAVTGHYAVLVCSGANACTIDTATIVNPGHTTPNTFGTEVTFTNVDLLHPTKVTITRIVNKNK